MKISNDGRVVTVEEGNNVLYYYISNRGILMRSNGIVYDNHLRYSETFKFTKYGKGRLKKEDLVHDFIERSEDFLRQEGYSFKL